MSPSSPCSCAVPLPGQCDPVLHAVDRLVIVGEEALDVPQPTLSRCNYIPGKSNLVLHAVDRLVIVGEEAMYVPQFTMCIRSSFTWRGCSCAVCS